MVSNVYLHEGMTLKNLWASTTWRVFLSLIFLTLHIASSAWLLLKSKTIFQTRCLKMLMCLRPKFHMPSAIRSSVKERQCSHCGRVIIVHSGEKKKSRLWLKIWSLIPFDGCQLYAICRTYTLQICTFDMLLLLNVGIKKTVVFGWSPLS